MWIYVNMFYSPNGTFTRRGWMFLKGFGAGKRQLWCLPWCFFYVGIIWKVLNDSCVPPLRWYPCNHGGNLDELIVAGSLVNHGKRRQNVGPFNSRLFMAKWVWINTFENSILSGMNIHKSLFWCELQGYQVFDPLPNGPQKMSPGVPTSQIVSAWKLPCWFATIHSNWVHHFQVVVDLEDEQCRAENLCWEAMQWSKLKVPRATDFSSHFLYYNVPT